MTSAFDPPHAPRLLRPTFSPTTITTTQVPTSYHESETEDEEVKLNCIGGLRGMDEDDDDDSDLYGKYGDDDSDSEDSDQEGQTRASILDRRAGVVNFIARLVRPSPRIIKPAPSRQRYPALTPPLEAEEEEEDEEEVAEVGARGVALPFDDDDDEESELEDNEEEEPSDSEMEESVSGSDADESDMEEDDEDYFEEEQQPTLERPVLEEGFSQEDETASVILQVLEEEEDEEISSLIESASPASTAEPLLTDDESIIELGRNNFLRHPEAHLIGVTQDREDNNNLKTVPRVKRVLSLDESMFSTRDTHPIQEEQEGPKKRRKSDADGLLSFSLGPPAMTIPETPVECRFLSPTITSSEELEDEEDLEEELDGQLRHELESTASSGGDQSPVPLLTPPESPVMGATCEWPSNLVVDSALTAVLTQVRPLDSWSEVEDEPDTAKGPSFVSSSNLTPLLRGIQVSEL